jgi:hypothetical protein
MEREAARNEVCNLRSNHKRRSLQWRSRTHWLGRRSDTPSRQAEMIPTASWPLLPVCAAAPRYPGSSLPQRAEMAVFTTTSPNPGMGSG